MLLLTALSFSMLGGAIAALLVTCIGQNVLFRPVSEREQILIFFVFSLLCFVFSYFKTLYDLRKASPPRANQRKRGPKEK